MKTRTSTAGNKGFTLLELVVVLFIAGLSAAVVIFSIGRLHEQTLFNQEARKVYQAARHGRETALLQRKEVILRIDEEANSYWLEDRNKNITGKHTVYKGASITGKDIVFYPKGNSTGGSLTLRNAKGKEFHIEIDPILGTPSVKGL
ncbi:MAG: pilus assembly FimT family protein [Thermodesulfovibrionales bacterium]